MDTGLLLENWHYSYWILDYGSKTGTELYSAFGNYDRVSVTSVLEVMPNLLDTPVKMILVYITATGRTSEKHT